MSDYVTVFEIGNFRSKFFGLSFILIPALFSCAMLFVAKLNGWQRTSPTKAVISAILICFIGLIFSAAYYSDYYNLIKDIKYTEPNIVAGIVSDFQAYPTLNSDKMERFCVNDICFKYECCGVSASYDKMRKDGSPIRDGLPVRITYFGDDIIKLEVRQNDQLQNQN